jgi:hypothetical protein
MRPHARNLLIAVLLILPVLIGASGVRAASQVQVSETQVQYTFGESITFQAAVQSDLPITSGELFIHSQGRQDTQVIPVSISPQGELSSIYDLNLHPQRAFSTLTYTYRLTLANGEVYTSPRFQVYYEDNRYKWQSLENGPFRLHWYSGDVVFAQEVLNVAQAGLQHAQTLLPAAPPDLVQIYAYATAREMQAALLLSGQNWIAGHADPDLDVILVSLPAGPEQHLEMERQIPHELMHILLYQYLGPSYAKLPVWLNEGLASITELYPNPDYHVLLDTAHQNKDLLPIASLCQVFPRDASGALLAYAEAASFTRYLYNAHGTPGLEALINQYAAGLDCQKGAQQALGNNLTELEVQWRSDTFAENQYASALQGFLPYLFILGLILIFTVITIIWTLLKKTTAVPAQG